MNKLILKIILMTVLYLVLMLGLKMFTKDKEKLRQTYSITTVLYIVNLIFMFF